MSRFLVNNFCTYCSNFLSRIRLNYNNCKFDLAPGATLGLHYGKIIEGGNHLPVPVICGEHRLGKTRSARAALHLMGNGKQFFSSARECFILCLCSRSTFPPVLEGIKLGCSWWACTRLQVNQQARIFSLQVKRPWETLRYYVAWSQDNLKKPRMQFVLHSFFHLCFIYAW